MLQADPSMRQVNEPVELRVDYEPSPFWCDCIGVNIASEYVLVQNRLSASPKVSTEGSPGRARPRKQQVTVSYSHLIIEAARPVVEGLIGTVEVLNSDYGNASSTPIGSFERLPVY
jgi:hypothetical protein